MTKTRLITGALAFLLVASSCGKHYNDPIITEEKNNPSQDSLYTACKSLEGLGAYRIGKTTLKALMNDRDYRNNCSGLYQYERGKSNLYNGHWGSRFLGTTDIDRTIWMQNNCRGEVKQIVSSGEVYKIGETSFKEFSMAFLNDTLVAIRFVPIEDDCEAVLEHFKEKYGPGKGETYMFYQDSKSSRKYWFVLDEYEHTTWENERIILKYDYEEGHDLRPGMHNLSREFKREYMVYSKKRLPVFEQRLKEWSRKYDETQQAKKSESVGAL